jgi:hypothetical protein
MEEDFLKTEIEDFPVVSRVTFHAARLMHLRVYDSRDSSRQPAPSPSVCCSLTHVHRSIGYRNRNPQPLAESAT